MIRLLDISVSLIVIIFLALPIFIIALAIWLEDRDPILFKQKRVGRQNQTFLIYKFRTMINDCGRFQGDLIGSSLNESEREVSNYSNQ